MTSASPVVGKRPEFPHRNIRRDVESVSILASQRLAIAVVVSPEVETAAAELRRWGEEGGESEAARIHIEVVRDLPMEFCLGGDWPGRDSPLAIRPPLSDERDALVHQSGVRFRRSRFQLGNGSGIGLELLALLYAEWQKQYHAHHF